MYECVVLWLFAVTLVLEKLRHCSGVVGLSLSAEITDMGYHALNSLSTLDNNKRHGNKRRSLPH